MLQLHWRGRHRDGKREWQWQLRSQQFVGNASSSDSSKSGSTRAGGENRMAAAVLVGAAAVAFADLGVVKLGSAVEVNSVE